MDYSNLNNNQTENFPGNIDRQPVSPIKSEKHSSADFVNIERRAENHAVFHVDDSSFISSLPRATHWSIAWSDLMMTMFILFLTMFVYQAANEEFLGKKTPEIIGGDTTEALGSMDTTGAVFPFAPIHPGIPLMTAGTIKKIERIHTDIPLSDSDSVVQEGQSEQSTDKQVNTDFQTSTSGQIALMLPESSSDLPSPQNSIPFQSPEEVLEPLPLNSTTPEPLRDRSFQEIFVLNKDAMKDKNLDKFAAIEVIPDKTVRIILTSDLLFSLGKSELSNKAKKSLEKIAQIIRLTPYMINVVGHTDNIPMQSYRFASNWELSVARATTVTRFFIDDNGMDPTQFVVSGYSSYRPMKPNTNAANRAKNRRVEIIISKRLPKPALPTTANLQ